MATIIGYEAHYEVTEEILLQDSEESQETQESEEQEGGE